MFERKLRQFIQPALLDFDSTQHLRVIKKPQGQLYTLLENLLVPTLKIPVVQGEIVSAKEGQRQSPEAFFTETASRLIQPDRNIAVTHLTSFYKQHLLQTMFPNPEKYEEALLAVMNTEIGGMMQSYLQEVIMPCVSVEEGLFHLEQGLVQLYIQVDSLMLQKAFHDTTDPFS